MGKIAVYTCIIGDYDTLREPAVLSPEFDFICFVGAGERKSGREGAWEIRELRPDSGPAGDRQLLSRYPKMHPHTLLPDYECSVWIDGNIAVTGPALYSAALKACGLGVLYAGVSHPDRDSVYAEARKCRDMNYLSYAGLLRIWATLFVHGVPLHGGLMENNLIFRRHNDPRVIEMDTLWWRRVLHFCRRDQLSLMWTLGSTGIPVEYLLPKGHNTRNTEGFEYLLHK